MPKGDKAKHRWSYMQRAILRMLDDKGKVSAAFMAREFRPETINMLVVAGVVGVSGPTKQRVYELTAAGKEEVTKWRGN